MKLNTTIDKERRLTMFQRVIVLVMDSVGIGALPDADQYGDAGANTLGNIARSLGGLFLPVMNKLGLGAVAPIEGLKPVTQIGFYGKMAEKSHAKDTTSGHWELAGQPIFTPFPVYPNAFPEEVISKFVRLINRPVLGNKVASGTEIIAELGAEHMATGYPIVYTSADSVFQIAAHEDIIPLPDLYEMCRIAREQVCVGEHAVGRIIARPFIGVPGNFTRTANRHDYSLEPNGDTVLDTLKKDGFAVIGIGKISDIYAHRGITRSFSSKSNDDGMSILLDLVRSDTGSGLIMANLVEFDSTYGHRNDVVGYGRALERLDGQLALLIDSLQDSDLLIITADHGCDPTFAGSDHTREYVPLLVYYHNCPGGELGIRETFADVGQTIADNFSIAKLDYGRSFLHKLVR